MNQLKILLPKLKGLFTVLVLLLVGFQIYLSSWLSFRGDVFYNEDIARDLLLLEDIVTNHHLTLIGPRISVAGGLFHGPLWLYINLPAYLIGHGNPFIMGIFWQLLYTGLLVTTYFLAKKMFDHTVALFSVLLLSSATYTYVFSNTYGALLLFPLYFFIFIEYLKTTKIKYLLIAFFLSGLMIQFEVAFAAPILLASVLYLIYLLSKKKKLAHLLSFFIILIPLATYILFDLRHQSLQLHAAINFITSHPNSNHHLLSLSTYLSQHFSLIINSSLHAFTQGNFILTIIMILIYLSLPFLARKKNFADYQRIYILFFILYGGFWILSLIYKDGMWVWYYNEFTPIMAVVFCSAYRLINKYLFVIIFLLFYGISLQNQISAMSSVQNNFVGKNSYSWQLYATLAKNVYANAPQEFGYYINEHDSLGYRTRYAMHYVQRSSVKTGSENIKKTTTYLIEEKVLDNQWWEENKVHISVKPVSVISIDNLYQIKKIKLNQKEITIPSDGDLINNLFFR